MGATIGLRNIVGEAKHLLRVGVVPLHRDFNGDGDAILIGVSCCVENDWMKDRLCPIDVLDKSTDAASESEIFVFAITLICQANFHAII